MNTCRLWDASPKPHKGPGTYCTGLADPQDSALAPAVQDLRTPQGSARAPTVQDLRTPQGSALAPAVQDLRTPQGSARAPAVQDLRTPQDSALAPTRPCFVKSSPGNLSSNTASIATKDMT